MCPKTSKTWLFNHFPPKKTSSSDEFWWERLQVGWNRIVSPPQTWKMVQIMEKSEGRAHPTSNNPTKIFSACAVFGRIKKTILKVQGSWYFHLGGLMQSWCKSIVIWRDFPYTLVHLGWMIHHDQTANCWCFLAPLTCAGPAGSTLWIAGKVLLYRVCLHIPPKNRWGLSHHLTPHHWWCRKKHTNKKGQMITWICDSSMQKEKVPNILSHLGGV